MTASIKIKTCLLTECLNCKKLFIKKLETISNISILMKNNKSEISFSENKNKIILIKIMKEEVFINLPILSKHNLQSCILNTNY